MELDPAETVRNLLQRVGVLEAKVARETLLRGTAEGGILAGLI